MSSYLDMQLRLVQQAREKILDDARDAGRAIRDLGDALFFDLDHGDLEAARTRLAELAQRIPQYLAPIDHHLKEADIVKRLAANLRTEEAAR